MANVEDVPPTGSWRKSVYPLYIEGQGGIGSKPISMFTIGDDKDNVLQWTKTLKNLASIAALVFGLASAAHGGVPTTNLGLNKWAKGDQPSDYLPKQNADQDTLDAAICDKRVGCVITGNLAVTGALVATILPSTAAVVVGSLTTVTTTQAYSILSSTGIRLDAGQLYLTTGTSVRWPNGVISTAPKAESFITAPSVCTVGNYARGVDLAGNALGCAPIVPGGDAATASTQTFTGSNTFANPSSTFTVSELAVFDSTVVISALAPVSASTPTANSLSANRLVQAWGVYVASSAVSIDPQLTVGITSATFVSEGVYIFNWQRPFTSPYYFFSAEGETAGSVGMVVCRRSEPLSASMVVVRCINQSPGTSNPSSKVSIMAIGPQ